ncbi:hypothetical protein [Alteromonas antoniana]|uniref:hypothetical protein n=1 Tax=Alteromonas antoniana TaxID=2803813 RepID=UPI001C4771FA|nr:hypothetical protein [Alteromonas antoniana]
MKTWLLIPLVMFIAVAGYQFGYYRAKLESSEADKVRVAGAMDKQPASSETDAERIGDLLNANVIASVEAAETAAAPTQRSAEFMAEEVAPTQESVEAVKAGSETRKKMRETHSDWADNFDENEQNFEAATQLADFFTLHPDGENVYLHSIQCDDAQCQLVGQFEGEHQRFESIINEMKEQPWWEYSGTSSNTSSDGSRTHFILHLTSARAF